MVLYDAAVHERMGAREGSITPVAQGHKSLSAAMVDAIVHNDSEADGKTPKSLVFRLALASVYFGVFIVTFNQFNLGPALPAVAKDLHASSTEAFWCGTGYLLAQTTSQPIYGSLSGVYGRKAILLVALVIFTGCTVLCSRSTM